MRVLYVIQHKEFSGAEITHVPLMRSDPDALLACPPGSATERLAHQIGVSTTPLEFRSLRVSGGLVEGFRSVARGLRSAHDLRRVLKANPERTVVFCTSVRPAMIAALAAIGLRRRLVWCVPDFLPGFPVRQAVRLLALATAHRALCPSHAIKVDFAGRWPRLGRVSGVVYPGVDASSFDGRGAEAGSPVAALVGHISPTKRTDLAVEIASRVAAARPDFRLRVVGRAQFRAEDEELERALRKRVSSEPALARSVEFTGYVSDIASALEGCVLLLHCRPDEPFGIVLIEAMAMRLPVVAPAAAGPLEIVEDGVTGLLYPPNDVEGAIQRVLQLLERPKLARAMGAEGRRRVDEHFTQAAQLAATQRLLEEAGA